MSIRTSLVWKSVGVGLLAASRAFAGGFEVPDNGVRAVGRGGATAVGVTDLTAVQYNPGALAKLSTPLAAMWHHNLVFHEATFTRAPLDEAWGDPYAGTTSKPVSDKESLFPLGAFVSLGSSFGLEDWMFAASVYGPSSVGKQEWEDYGPQSFMLTETDLILVYYSLSAAWKHEDTFGFGITLQYVDMPRLRYELVVDGDPAVDEALYPLPLDGGAKEGGRQLATRLDLSDRFAYTAIVGGWWRVHRNVELGVAGRILPVNLEAEGGVDVDRDELVTKELTVRLPLTLPVQARGGIRYLTESFDAELDVFWENWSTIDRYDVHMNGAISGKEVDDLVLEKQWSDTVSVRLGGDYRVLPETLDVRAGGFWESAAAPENYSHIDFPSFMRFGVGGGLTWHLPGNLGLDLSAAYMHIFQEDREVDEAHGKQFQQRPISACPAYCNGRSGVVANAGKFETSYDILSLGLDYRY